MLAGKLGKQGFTDENNAKNSATFESISFLRGGVCL